MGCASEPTPLYKKASTKSYFESEQEQAVITHLRALSADTMYGRKFASAQSQLAQQYITTSLIASNVKGFQQKFLHQFEHNTLFSQKIGTNVIAWVEGTEYPDKYIVLSAHYDHLGMEGTKIYNGADDNASGTSALLAFGEVIAKKPLKHSIIFLFTDGEEVNILGAKAFIVQQAAIVPSILLNINLDMIAGNKHTKVLHYIDKQLETVLAEDKLKIFYQLTEQSSILIKRNFRKDLHRVYSRTRWNNASDHAAFYQQNIPFIYYGVGEHSNYHTTRDDFSHVNIPFFLDTCASIFHFLLFLDENIK